MKFIDLHALSVDIDSIFTSQLKELLQLALTATGSQGVHFYFYSASDHAFVLKQSLLIGNSAIKKKLSEELPFLQNLKQPDQFGTITSDPDVIQAMYDNKNGNLPACVMIVPIFMRGEVVGFLFQEHDKEHYFKDNDLSLSAHVARLVGSALNSTELLDQLQERTDHLAILLEVNRHLTAAVSKSDFVAEISRFSHYFLNFDRAVLALRNEELENYYRIDSIAGESSWLQEGMMLRLDNTLVGAAIRQGHRQIYRASEKTPFEGIYKIGDLADYNFGAAVVFPLANQPEGPGALVLEFRENREFDEAILGIFGMVALNLGAALNRLMLYDKLKEFATIDPLSRVYNLRALKERLQEEISRSTRYQLSLTILFCDLDKFKRINDTYGHLMGDYVIRETAKVIKESVRTADIVGRYGGEEFVVGLISTDAKNGSISANRICHAIAEHNFEWNDIKVNMHISIGLCEFPKDGKTMEELIEAADAAMYQAKRQGGNRVVVYEPGMVAPKH